MANPYTEEMFANPPPPPPDATVDSILYDETVPGWAEVSFSDGSPPRTMPAEEAEALPKTPTAPAGPAPYDATFGPPGLAAPVEGPNAITQQWEAAGQDPIVQATEAATAPPGYAAPLGRPTNPAPPPADPSALGRTGTGAAQPNMAEIVAPGTPGGSMAPAETAITDQRSQTEFIGDPEEVRARTQSAYEREAEAQRVTDWQTYQSKYGANITAEFGAREQQARAERARLEAEETRKAHERIIAAMDDTPIDPDDFWNKSPGRTAAAWVALALSGFLQGVTRGQNPALNQMVQALNHAQDRWLQNLKSERAGQYARREAGIRDARATEDSYRMQIDGILSKRIDLAAQRAGMPVPPGLETYRAKGAVEAAKAMERLDMTARAQATESVQQTLKAQAATGPQTRFDVELRALGIDRAAHQKAMTDEDLGGKVGALTELEAIRGALRKIAEQHGGQLPAQSTLSWSQLGLDRFAGRPGWFSSENAAQQVETKQLLDKAVLSYIQTLGNVKTIDANAERERLQKVFDTGIAESTLAELDSRVRQSEQIATGIASGFAGGNAGRYLDLLRAQATQAGEGGAPPTTFRPLGLGGRGAPARPADEGGTAPADRPLPPAAGREPARPRPSLDDSDEIYQPPDRESDEPVLPATRQAIQEHAAEAGYDPDALARIVNFESGGKPWISNKSSGATGLIQFMPSTFRTLKKPPGYENIRFEDLPHLSADEQMPLVIQYFRQAGLPADADAGEMYLAVAAPGFLGKPDDRVVYPKGSKAWELNRAWRPADGGDITVGDIRRKGRSLRAP